MREFLCVRLAMVSVLLAAAWSLCWAQEPAAPNAALTKIGMDKEIWIAARTDRQPGTGAASDPLDGSTQEKFDRILVGLNKAKVTNITIHLGAGTFATLGEADWRNPQDLLDPCTGWHMDTGWKLLGAGMGNTTVKLGSYCNEFRHRAAIAAKDGVWKISSAPEWFGAPEIWQGIRLVEGKGLKGVEAGKVYYIAGLLDDGKFRVSARPGGPPIADAAVSEGICYRIVKVRRGGEMMSSVIQGEGADIEVRDLTVDINWPSFGGVVTEDFKMPAELQTVIVAVESVDWARPLAKPWVYLVTPLKVHKAVGHFELVRVVDDRHVELRNMQNFKLQSGQAFRDEGTTNVPPGTVVAKGTRMGPEMVTAGVLVEGDRATVQRVRITNQTGTWYEGGCSIGIGSWGGKPYHGMAIRDCITDNMWGGLTSGIHILSGKISWQNSYPLPAGSAVDGAQGVIEGNTILANGVFHSGLGVGGAVNTVIRNNKVVNAGAGLYSEGPLHNVAIRDNFFSECREGSIFVGSGNAPLWEKGKTYAPDPKEPWKTLVLWKDVEYLAKVQNVGKEPPDEQYWEPQQPWNGNLIIEGNTIEVERASGIALPDCASGAVIRGNTLRCASSGQIGAAGLNIGIPSTRRVIITGNIIESRLRNYIGDKQSIVFGKDNVDERGRIRWELEEGEHMVNLALGAKASASSVLVDRVHNLAPEMAIDGRFETWWNSAYGQTGDQWLEIDFGKEVSLNTVLIEQQTTWTRFKGYHIQSWKDNVWKDVYSGAEMPDNAVCRFPTVTTRKLRLLMDATRTPTGLREVGVYRYGGN